MTQQTFKALEFIKRENLDYALWDIVPEGRTAWGYTLWAEDENIELPAHVVIWYTEEMCKEDEFSFLKSAPFTFKIGYQDCDCDEKNDEYVAIFPFEISE